MTMTVDERVAALLGRGYFPKELPPPFQTGTLADKAATIKPKWAALRAAMSRKDRDKHPYPSHPILFDMARKGHARRTLSIPNVVNQYFLTEEIAERWNQLKQLIDGSSLSLTKCEISADEGRAIPLPPLTGLAEKRVMLSAAQGAILQTDVLSFYHSIYTHAISWALHGKSAAKQNRNSSDPNMFGNRIDALVRSCHDGQTVGIPVGPDTSRVISEIMLCAVEQKIGKELHDCIKCGFRYVDDFFLCFDSISDAERVLAGIREACLHYDLQLNPAKTRTIPALGLNEETWPNEISAMRIEHASKGQRRSLMRFFSNVINMSQDLPDESIASFAVRKTTKTIIDEKNWDLYEAFLLRMARENSNCIDAVTKILCTYAAIGYQITPSVSLFIERVISDHAPYNHHYEVAWALWLAKSLKIRLSPSASTLVQRVENDICALLCLHLRSIRLLSGPNQIASWLGPVTVEDLSGTHWLLIYEASLRKSWGIASASSAVAGDGFYDALKSEGVSFFNTRANNRPLNLPGIEFKLRSALGGRSRALLPGGIMAFRGSVKEDDGFEELGGDYGDDDWHLPFSPFDSDDDSD